MLPFILILMGAVSRILIHEPNFTPVISIALFSGVYLNRKYAVILPLAVMILSDIFLGWHNTILFTWGSLILIAYLGVWTRNHKTASSLLAINIAGALSFFLITNFGVWVVGGLYPMTFEGLQQCFIAAIPFYRGTFLSTILYSTVLFGIYEFVACRVKGTRLAHVLLSC